jgi:hypothetical protein
MVLIRLFDRPNWMLPGRCKSWSGRAIEGVVALAVWPGNGRLKRFNGSYFDDRMTAGPRSRVSGELPMSYESQCQTPVRAQRLGGGPYERVAVRAERPFARIANRGTTASRRLTCTVPIRMAWSFRRAEHANRAEASHRSGRSREGPLWNYCGPDPPPQVLSVWRACPIKTAAVHGATIR